MTGPDLDPQLSASMRRTILAHARKSTGRKHSPRQIITALGSIALVTGVAATAVVIIVAGLPRFGTTPPVANTPTTSETASPTPSSDPTSTPTPAISNTPTDAPTVEPQGPTAAELAEQACQKLDDRMRGGSGDWQVVLSEAAVLATDAAGTDPQWEPLASNTTQLASMTPPTSDMPAEEINAYFDLEVIVIENCKATGVQLPEE